VLSEILNTQITVTRSNEGRAKASGPLYAKVKSLALYDQAFLDKMLENRFARHFWSEAELQQARRRLRGDYQRPDTFAGTSAVKPSPI
jgi:hypothetical protein